MALLLQCSPLMKKINRFIVSLLLPLTLACSPILPIQSPSQKVNASQTSTSTSNPNPLRIIAIDIGQGDSTLIIGPGPSGKTILIDGGPVGAGVSAILPTLSSLGVTHLDWIIATHYDADHIGGLPEVLKDLIPLRGILDRGDNTDKSTPIYRSYLLAAAGLRRQTIPGMKIELGNNASLEVIVVNGRYADGRTVFLNPDEENESCIGTLIQYGDFTYFTAGDLTGGGSPGGYETKDMETIAGDILGDINVLHIGHHGSDSSTNETFLTETKPEAAIISVGKNNDYGHPKPTVLKRLNDSSTTIYRTDLMGSIEVTSTGEGFKINPL